MKQGKGLSRGGGLRPGKGLNSEKGLDSGKGLSSKKSMKKISKKQSSRNTELYEVYDEMKQTRELRCTGCTSHSNLSHSHLIARSKREDLITDPKNITYHCDTCHEIWEHGTLKELKEMNDFLENMEYIKSVDEKHYQLIMLNR